MERKKKKKTNLSYSYAIHSPNLITLIGFGFVVANMFLVMYFIPDLETPGPTWVYFR